MRSALVSMALLGALVIGARTAVAQKAPEAGALYKQHCVTCHGATGVPAPAMAKALGGIPTFDAAFFGKVSADSMLAVLKNGSGKNMKSFKDKLSNDQMAEIVKYIRSTFLK